jgi:hypothetical protein
MRLPNWLVKPDYKNNITTLPPTICDIFNVKAFNDRPRLQHNLLDIDLDGINKVVLYVIDSFGYNLFNLIKTELRKIGFPTYLFKSLSSVFPSTTTAAITSLMTGYTPQEHGLVGYMLFLKEYGAIADMIRLSPIHIKSNNALIDYGLDPQKFLGIDTLQKILSEHGIESYALVKKAYKDSGLSKLLYTNTQIIPHITLSDLYVQLRKILNAKKGHTGYFYIYWDIVDTLSHQYTPISDESKAELINVFLMLKEELISKLDPEVARETLIIIIGDHGQSYIDKSNVVITNSHPDLLNMLIIPPTGETRVSYLYVKDNMEDDVINYFEKNFPDRFYIIRSHDAIKEGLFGIGNPRRETIDRIGNLIILPKPGNGVMHMYEEKELDWEKRGSHGGLTPDEIRVTFMISKISDLQYKRSTRYFYKPVKE